jgi:hypothetical protein
MDGGYAKPIVSKHGDVTVRPFSGCQVFRSAFHYCGLRTIGDSTILNTDTVKRCHTIPPSGVPLIHSPVGLIGAAMDTAIAKPVVLLMDTAKTFVLINRLTPLVRE